MLRLCVSLLTFMNIVSDSFLVLKKIKGILPTHDGERNISVFLDPQAEEPNSEMPYFTMIT